jgi:3-hydroxyacyl-CoA dehydrogenase
MASKSVIKHVSVFGSGLMGSGIAQVTAAAGYQVTLFDQSDSILNKAISSIKTSLQRTVKKKFADEPAKGAKFVDETMSRISTSSTIPSSSLETDLVIEAIVENLKAKHSLFGNLDKVTPPQALFASNTSSLSIGDIAQSVQRKDKFGGLHFFNPVPMMKLLEVIRTENTSAQTHQDLLSFGKSIGKG